MGKTPSNEEELVARICTGDDFAFRSFVDSYKDRVVGYLYRLIPNESDREEVCQDVFVKVYLNLKGFRFESALSTWLYRIAWYTAISHLRKTKRIDSRYRSNDGLDEDGLFSNVDRDQVDEDASFGESPFSDTLNQEISDLIKEEISCLAPEERSVLALYHYLELRVSDIGQIMEKPEGTIKSELYRIRKKLKKRIQLRLPEEYQSLASEGVSL